MANTDYFAEKQSDNYRKARSHVLNALADGTYNLIRIPQYAFVKDVFVYLSTAYNTVDATVSIGWLGNKETAQTAGFMSSDVFRPTVVGTKRAVKDTLLAFEGKWFDAANGAVTCTIAKGTATTLGVFIVFVDYCVIH